MSPGPEYCRPGVTRWPTAAERASRDHRTHDTTSVKFIDCLTYWTRRWPLKDAILLIGCRTGPISLPTLNAQRVRGQPHRQPCPPKG